MGLLPLSGGLLRKLGFASGNPTPSERAHSDALAFAFQLVSHIATEAIAKPRRVGALADAYVRDLPIHRRVGALADAK